MTSLLEKSDVCIARVRAAPSGEIELVPGDESASVYGPVEIAWYPDRLQVTAIGAGQASLTDVHTGGAAAQDVVLEIRLPRLDELTETVPGAD
jgi:hypothetical protein